MFSKTRNILANWLIKKQIEWLCQPALDAIVTHAIETHEKSVLVNVEVNGHIYKCLTLQEMRYFQEIGGESLDGIRVFLSLNTSYQTDAANPNCKAKSATL